MKLSNPRDLFLQLLGQMLWLERELVREALPALERGAQAQSLAQAFAEHLEQTRDHVARVEEVFGIVAAEPSSNLDEAAQQLIEQHDRLAGGIVDPVLRDVFHAAAAARTEHAEIAAYTTLIALAEALELPAAVRLLERNRDEEAEALEQVERAAERLLHEVARAG
jgi:ferritin-like metal-binding protein YciE